MTSSSPGAQANVYDERGTILFRVVPARDDSGGVVGVSPERVSNSAGDAAARSPTPNRSRAARTVAASSVQHSAHTDATKTPASNKHTLALTQTQSLALTQTQSLAQTQAQSLAQTQAQSLAQTQTQAQAHARASVSAAARESQGNVGVEQALALLFPPEPLPLSAEGGAWRRVAALDHTGRMDALQLQDHLQRRCAEEHARPSGVLCTIREGIYTDGLREVLRQTTVLCPERGLLLAEIAAAMQQTTNTYDILFDNACQYAVRKGIERDLQSSLFVEKEQLESEVRRLENRVSELRAKHEGMMKRFEEQREAEKKLHEEEVKYLKKANLQIVSEIKRLTALEKLNAAAAAQAAGSGH